jgi:sialic acid synthase SpsE
MEGPDHFASLDPKELKRMVEAIRNVEKAFGDGQKYRGKDEVKNVLKMRRSIHANQNLNIGIALKNDDVKITRPADGIEPWHLDVILGKVLRKNVPKDDPIKWEDI